MRTSLRLFAAALSALLAAAFLTIVPFAAPAHAIQGVTTVAIQNVTIDEATATIAFNVTVNPKPIVPFADVIDVTIESVDTGSARAGKDYVPIKAHVHWEPGDAATKPAMIDAGSITDDAHREADETIPLVVKTAKGATPGTTGTITIHDNEGGAIPTFQVTPNVTSDEGNAATTDHVISIALSTGSGAPDGVDLDFATEDDSATSDPEKGAKDYVPQTGTLHWATNDVTPKQITIKVNGDTIPEPEEIIKVHLGHPSNAQLNVLATPVTIHNDDEGTVPTVSVLPIPDKLEGDSGATNQVVTVTLSAPAPQIVTVDYVTSDGTAIASTQDVKGDYTPAKGTVKISQGESSGTFNVSVNGDSADEVDEIYHVALSKPTNVNAGTMNGDAKILNDDYGQISTVPGAGGGGGPHVRNFGANGSDLGGWFAYDQTLTSGLHVARGDFFKADGSIGADGVDEIVVAPGKFANKNLSSKPLVRILATDGTIRASFYAYDQGFDGGVYVAAGNIDGDPSNGDELVTGAGPGGGPQVKVFRIKSAGDNVAVLGSFFPYDPKFPGGVRVAVGNAGGDAKAEIITAPGPGGGPHIKVNRLNAQGGADVVNQWFAYGPSFAGGVFIAAQNDRIVTGAGAGGGPHVKLFDGSGAEKASFFAYAPNFSGGVSVGLGNLDNDLEPEIVTGAGPGGGPHVKVFKKDGSMPFGPGFFAYAPNFGGGVEVAVAVANG